MWLAGYLSSPIRDWIQVTAMKAQNPNPWATRELPSLFLFLVIWVVELVNWFEKFLFLFYYFFPSIFISWRLITLQYCSGVCHTLTWISHGFTSIPHPDPLSHLPLHLIPLGLPSAPALSTCFMHPAWAGDLFHPRYTWHAPLCMFEAYNMLIWYIYILQYGCHCSVS